MCGISGIVNKNFSPVSLDLIKSINDLVHHRGPDGEGFFLEKNLAFGHRRLAIIDTSEEGKQPMAWGERYTITYNGEVYNYLELKKELENLGYHFKTKTDTEVVLASFSEWGVGCFSKFNGMWSFAIYDRRENKIICCRDRFGIKPFYYHNGSDHFVFGSEIKQCLPFIPSRRANIAIVMDFIVLGAIDHTTQTFFEGINTLAAGSYLVYDLTANKFTIERYYQVQVNEQAKNLTQEQAVHSFKEEFENSVKLRLRSDVVVGTCLSGGLDSSLLAAIASRRNQEKTKKQFKAITAGSVDLENDETEYAKIVAKAVNLEWHLIKPSTAEFRRDIEAIIKIQEEPFGGASIAMQYYVMKEARRNGITVLLDGQGADETLLGYDRHIATVFHSSNFFKKISFFASARKHYGISYRKVLEAYLYNSYSFLRKIYLKRRVKNIESQYLKNVSWSLIDRICANSKCILELQKHELTILPIPSLLKVEDKNSMAWSIEARLPYLDYSLVEHNLSLPTECKIYDGWSKIIIRKNMSGILPDIITWRKKKIGFNSPDRSWFGDKQWMIQEIESSPLIRTLYNGRSPIVKNNDLLWRLFNLAVWSKIYKIDI